MATIEPTQTLNINIPEIPSETDSFDDEESFIVLGESPTSFMLNEEHREMLKAALDSIDENLADVKKDELGEKSESLKTIVEEKIPSLRTEELETLKDDIANLKIEEPNQAASMKESFSLATFGSDLSIEEIHSKVEGIVEENNKLKETIVQNNVAMKKQYDTIVKWQEDVQKVHDMHKEKFKQTKAYIEELQCQIRNLDEALQESQSKVTELTEKLEKSAVAKSSYDNVLQFELEAARTKVDQLQQELQQNKEATEKVGLEYELQLAAANKNADFFKNKCDTLMRDETQSRQEELENIRQQLMNAQMHITQLEQAGASARETVNEQQQQIASLQCRLSEPNRQSDEFAALHAQLDVYKSDYEAELLAKNTYISKNNQLMEDLQNVQRRNHQLIEEMERLRGHDFVEVEHQQRPSAPLPQHEFVCPKCSFKFRNYQALENHVYRCIELDQLP